MICIGHSGISAGLNKVCNVDIELKGLKVTVVRKVTEFFGGKRREIGAIGDAMPMHEIISKGFERRRKNKRFSRGQRGHIINPSSRLFGWRGRFKDDLLVISRLRRGDCCDRRNRLVDSHGMV